MSTTILAPYSAATAVTTHDTNLIPVTDGIYVGGAGNVVVRTKNGDTVTFAAVPVGTTLHVAVDRITTASTATLMLALYR